MTRFDKMSWGIKVIGLQPSMIPPTACEFSSYITVRLQPPQKKFRFPKKRLSLSVIVVSPANKSKKGLSFAVSIKFAPSTSPVNEMDCPG